MMGKLLPMRSGSGNMKTLFHRAASPTIQTIAVASDNNITIDTDYTSIGSGNTVTIATIDFEKNTCFREVVDVDVYEACCNNHHRPKHL